MIRILIADDEEIIRKGLAKLISKDPNFEPAILAEDGETSLALADQYNPDLLLVDINMPFMNGLEFVEAVQQHHRSSLVIIITGYDSFNYAQKALKLRVFDYLLKPVMEDSLNEVLTRAKAVLLNDRRNVDYLAWAKEKVDQDRSHLIHQMLSEWLQNEIDREEAERQCSYLELKLPEKPSLTLLGLVPDESQMQPGAEWDETLLYYAAENIISDVFAPLSPLIFSGETSGVLALLSETEPEEQLQKCLTAMQEALHAYLPVRFTCVSGKVSYESLPEDYTKISDQLSDQEKIPDLVAQVYQIIDHGFTDPELSLQSVSEQLHVSPQHLGRLLRAAGGGNFSTMLTAARIRHAVKLLKSPDMKMYEVAERSGYTSQYYFSAAFKKILGISPVQYRHELLKDEPEETRAC